MDWYYAQDQKRNGPVADAMLQDLVRAGTVRPETLVWHEGMADWQPLSSVSLAFSQSSAAQIRCTECGFYFPEADILQVGGSSVCAACKPAFLDKVALGAPTGSPEGLWRRKKELVSNTEATLPDRCVKCNAPSTGPKLKRRLFWHHPALYAIFLVGVLFYVIFAAIFRKKATLYIGLCEMHRKRRLRAILIGWGLFLVSVGLFTYGGITGSANPAVWISAAVLLLAGIFTGAFAARLIYATNINDKIARVGGVCPAFLAELPEWTGD